MKLVVLRPQPGADTTAARALEEGFDVLVAPLFEGRALSWSPPDPRSFDALLLTSANALRYAGPGVAAYRHLQVYAVGEATAASAVEAGFADVTCGADNVSALMEEVAAGPHKRLLHLCGAHRTSIASAQQIAEVPVYEMRAADRLSEEAERALHTGGVAMAHSHRAARTLGGVVDASGIPREGVSVIAISAATAAAAGEGWREVVAAPAPTDAAMLAIARALCDRDAT